MSDYYRPMKSAYLTDTRLSGDAIKVANYIAAQKRGYVLNQDSLRRQLNAGHKPGDRPYMGRDRMGLACAELRKFGYLVTDKPKHANGRLSQRGSVLNWATVVADTDTLKSRVTVSPAETPQKPRSYSNPESPGTSIQGDITNMTPLKGSLTKTEPRKSRCPHGAAPWMDCPTCGGAMTTPDGVPIVSSPLVQRSGAEHSQSSRTSEVLLKGIQTASTTDELAEIYAKFKNLWTAEHAAAATARKKELGK